MFTNIKKKKMGNIIDCSLNNNFKNILGFKYGR